MLGISRKTNKQTFSSPDQLAQHTLALSPTFLLPLFHQSRLELNLTWRLDFNQPLSHARAGYRDQGCANSSQKAQVSDI